MSSPVDEVRRFVGDTESPMSIYQGTRAWDPLAYSIWLRNRPSSARLLAAEVA